MVYRFDVGSPDLLRQGVVQLLGDSFLDVWDTKRLCCLQHHTTLEEWLLRRTP